MILQAYISLPQQIRKGMLIMRIIVSYLCIGVGCQQYLEKQENFKRELYEHN